MPLDATFLYGNIVAAGITFCADGVAQVLLEERPFSTKWEHMWPAYIPPQRLASAEEDDAELAQVDFTELQRAKAVKNPDLFYSLKRSLKWTGLEVIFGVPFAAAIEGVKMMTSNLIWRYCFITFAVDPVLISAMLIYRTKVISDAPATWQDVKNAFRVDFPIDWVFGILLNVGLLPLFFALPPFMVPILVGCIAVVLDIFGSWYMNRRAELIEQTRDGDVDVNYLSIVKNDLRDCGRLFGIIKEDEGEPSCPATVAATPGAVPETAETK
eukprot:NODE_1269_length_1013_cov_728.552905_g483_i1.p1 GENE.NODE_1269_length_1013_cov_728.552905_g483_i1~~NODE_1269_length_1013_cov_728.552905_g483_i1.p1  ORF type:complete len:270 (+),score=106.81 NODE_1269_length_1013_cov_728.552905_g483_i1:94-903(+)